MSFIMSLYKLIFYFKGVESHNQGKRIIIYSLLKMASSRENVLSKPHASMLHAFCACNYIRLPLSRQHKTSVFASRFTPLRHFQYKIGYNAFALITQSGPGGIINKSFVSTKAPAFILYFLFLTTSTVWLDAPSSSIRSALAS